jgi:hypothetical protein
MGYSTGNANLQGFNFEWKQLLLQLYKKMNELQSVSRFEDRNINIISKK